MEAIANPETLGFSAARLERIGAWMARYVDGGKLPGALTLVARHGEIAYLDGLGRRDVEAGAPWTRDTILRLYSMTKPITSVALMMLYEYGGFHLDDPIEAFLPEFAARRVLVPGARRLDQAEPAPEPLTVHHLLTHTSGLIYGFNGGLLGEAYEAAGISFAPRAGGLAAMVARLAKMPLRFRPGARWSYGVSTDVVGRLVEVISGQPLDRFFGERIFSPLGMTETAFGVADDALARFASLYAPDDGGMKLVESGAESLFRAPGVDTFSGGGGLTSTVHDYWRFAEMLRGGGSLDGERLLGPRTLAYMTRNHLPGDLASMGQPTFNGTCFAGIGFGLGFSVMLDAVRAGTLGSPGDHGWGGMASTTFWIDPVEDMVVIFLTQLIPSSTYPLRQELRALVYQALTD